MATGVLPVFVGQATRAVEFAENGEKEYIAGLRLGLVTNTQDTSGETLETHPVTVDRAVLEAVLPRFIGPIAQIPPMYSAIKINGQKLYDLARKGKEVERKPRNITIFELELLEQVSETAPLPLLQGNISADAVPRYRASAGLRRHHVQPPPHHGRRVHTGGGSLP